MKNNTTETGCEAVSDLYMTRPVPVHAMRVDGSEASYDRLVEWLSGLGMPSTHEPYSDFHRQRHVMVDNDAIFYERIGPCWWVLRADQSTEVYTDDEFAALYQPDQRATLKRIKEALVEAVRLDAEDDQAALQEVLSLIAAGGDQ
jgi:hypothetical protein